MSRRLPCEACAPKPKREPPRSYWALNGCPSCGKPAVLLHVLSEDEAAHIREPKEPQP
jgi:hypothetical protein